MFVFVYGTLKTGYTPNELLSDSEFIGEGVSIDKFDMLEGSFPMVVDSYLISPLPVKGEVYRVTSDTLGILDEFEGYPHLFKRKITPVMVDGTQHDCLMYVYNMESDEHDIHPLVNDTDGKYEW